LSAAAGTSLFFALAPGVVAGVIPWLLTRWEVRDRYWLPVRLLGAAMIAAGALALLHSFARFVSEGVGTPAPVAPTERLVVGGLYRYVRNPMYLSVTTIVLGEALLTRSPALGLYWAIWFLAANLFVIGYEEPTLRRQFGASYDEYTTHVGRWLPKLRSREPPS
jgi:protein-S-isoprenylcysteine O-methyltransferase Ste14